MILNSSKNVAYSTLLFSFFVHKPAQISFPCIIVWWALSQKFTSVKVWETAHHCLHNFLDLVAVVYIMSKHVGTLKWVTPCDPNFGEGLDYLQGFSNK
jgi:hypothetical protein